MTGTEQLVFGLDIGTRTVVGTVGYKKNENDFTVVAQEVKEHETRAMMDGQIHDIAKVAETIKSVKRSLENQLDGKKLDNVCIAAAGRVLKTVTVHVDEEFSEDQIVTDEDVRALELKGVEKAYSEIKRSKAADDENNYYCVAYSVVRYYLNDFQIMNLTDHKASRVGADVLATFLPDEVIEGLYTTVDKAGLKVTSLTLEPIAAIIVAIPEKFRLLNIALVDVGAGTSDISITKDGSIIAYGMIPKAGDSFTEVIAANHLVDFNSAEAIKLEAGSKKKSIVYKDIMGLKQTTTPAAVRAELADKIKENTTDIAAKIVELNGGKPVSAVFVVGGGGKLPGFTEALAKELGIPKERVALRGEEVLSFVNYPDSTYKRTPEFVTPIGICLNYYEKKNNFVFVNLNGDSVKLYDNNKLTVIDATIAAGFPKDKLFPRRGPALEFTLNGMARMVRGEAGEAAVITVNGREASANSIIEPNDDIVIKESTIGPMATMEVNRLPEYNRGEIKFNVNGKIVICPKFISANGELVSGYYDIKSGDRLELLDYYTLKQILEFMDIPYKEGMYVNNEPADADTKVYENFKVETEPRENAEPVKVETAEEIEEEASVKDDLPVTITVIVNGTAIFMSGKTEYRFVDVLDFYPFDIQNPSGSSVLTQINGKEASFSDYIKDGDSLVLKWV